MKRLIFFIALLVAAPAAHAEVFTRVCLADGNTPLELADPCIPLVYRPIMVGTRLTIIISSDTGGYLWSGGLYINDPYRNYGVLIGRDQNETTLDWQGSHLEAAGPTATVLGQQDLSMSGFELGSNDDSMPGDWFIIDYNAIEVGDCNVWLYDYGFNFDEPNYVMAFAHVPTRDFNNDGIVNFEDFAVFALNWRGTDLDADELMQFVEYWLIKTR